MFSLNRSYPAVSWSPPKRAVVLLSRPIMSFFEDLRLEVRALDLDFAILGYLFDKSLLGKTDMLVVFCWLVLDLSSSRSFSRMIVCDDWIGFNPDYYCTFKSFKLLVFIFYFSELVDIIIMWLLSSLELSPGRCIKSLSYCYRRN